MNDIDVADYREQVVLTLSSAAIRKAQGKLPSKSEIGDSPRRRVGMVPTG